MPHDHPDHISASGHPFRGDQDTPLTRAQIMEIAIRELLIERDLTTPSEVTAQIAAMDARSPANGAALVARAWTEPEFRVRLREDASAAARDLGFELGPLKLIAVENTPNVHNVIVCTLCSCYPRNLLGLPPDWYKQRAYRSRVVREPRAVLREFGTEIPDDVTIRVHDSTADMRYIVIPERPAGTNAMAEAELSGLVTRDGMIGVTRL